MEIAEELANAMVRVGRGLGIKTTAFITEMDNPIGKAVGNSVEVAEALECLNGKGPADLEELVCKQGMSINIYVESALLRSNAMGIMQALTFESEAAFVSLKCRLGMEGIVWKILNRIGYAKNSTQWTRRVIR